MKHLNEAILVYPNQPLILQAIFEVHWAAGRREEAKDQLIELHARFHDSFNKCHFAEIYFRMGKEEHAYRLLDEGIRSKEVVVPYIGSIPSLKKYQSQPRFRKLFKKINHPLYVD